MLAQRSLPVILKRGRRDVLQEQTGCHYAQRLLFVTGNENGIDIVRSFRCCNCKIFQALHLSKTLKTMEVIHFI